MKFNKATTALLFVKLKSDFNSISNKGVTKLTLQLYFQIQLGIALFLFKPTSEQVVKSKIHLFSSSSRYISSSAQLSRSLFVISSVNLFYKVVQPLSCFFLYKVQLLKIFFQTSHGAASEHAKQRCWRWGKQLYSLWGGLQFLHKAIPIKTE